MSLILSGTDGLSDVDGSAATPAIRGTDANTGIFFPAADTIAFAEGGVEAMRIDSSGDLILGKTSNTNANNRLYVVGPLASYTSSATTLATSATSASVRLSFAQDSSQSIFMGMATDGTNYPSYIQAANGDGTTASNLTLQPFGGNLLVGTTSANSKLTVNSGATTFVASLTSTGTNTYTPTASTSLVNSTLQLIGGNASGATTGIRISQSSSFELFFGGVQESGGAGAFVFQGYSGSGYAERARIDSSGKLLVGATSTTPYFDGAINGFDSIYPGVCAKNGTAATFVAVVWNAATPGDNKFITFGTEGSYTERGTIDYNRAGGLTRYNTTSDATLKNIIGDADGQRSLEILSTTRIREYAWKDDETQKPQIGVIAQELYETYKGAVSVGGDVQKTDEEGNVVTEYKSWGVDKTAFTFHLIKGWQEHERIIQEQQALITQLTARITALESA